MKYVDLNSDMKTVVDWLATPKTERTEKTIAELANRIGVGEATVYRWKKENNLQEIADKRARSKLGDSLPTVLNTIRTKAESGDFKFAKLYLEILGEYSGEERLKTPS